MKEWTLIVVIYADLRINGLEDEKKLIRELKLLYGDIGFCKLSETFEIFVIANHLEGNLQTGTIISDRFSVFHAKKSSGGINYLSELESHPTPGALQKPALLTSVFKKIDTNGYPDIHSKASKYFVITWDHGSVFGIFRRVIDWNTGQLFKSVQEKALGIVQISKSRLIREEVMHVYIKNLYSGEVGDRLALSRSNDRYYKSFQIEKVGLQLLVLNDSELDNFISSVTQFDDIIDSIRLDFIEDQIWFNKISTIGFTDMTKNVNPENSYLAKLSDLIAPKTFDVLTNEELAMAINDGFEKRSVDVMLMMNCYSMNLHTCMAFSEKVRYLVAPQGGIDEPNYNFSVIFDAIQKFKHPDTAETIVKSCIDSVIKVDPFRRMYTSTIQTWAIFGVKADYIAITELVANVARICIENFRNSDFRLAAIDARARCIKLDGNCMYNTVDFMHWFGQFIINLTERNITGIWNAELQVLMDTILREITRIKSRDPFIGVKWFGDNVQAGYITKNLSGLSVFFPKKLDTSIDEYQYFISPTSEYQSAFIKKFPEWIDFLKEFY